jgi:SUKH-3 immunity protein
MAHESLRPSPEAERILRTTGWSPDRTVDIDEWVATLRQDGNNVSPVAEAILKGFGGLKLRHKHRGGPSQFDLRLDPATWYGERDRVLDIEEILKSPACPLGEFSGGAMLAVLEDGRVVSAFEGDMDLLGDNWSSALDLITLGRGQFLPLAKDYAPVDRS